MLDKMLMYLIAVALMDVFTIKVVVDDGGHINICVEAILEVSINRHLIL